MGMNERATAEIVARIFAVNGKTPDVMQLAAWHDCIKEIDPDVAVTAAQEMMKTEDGFPTVARFLSYVDKFYVGSAPSLEAACTEVLTAIADIGHYGTPTWSHPAIGAAVDSIGWKDICASENDYWKAWFARAYENSRKSHTTGHRSAITSGRGLSLDTSKLFAIGESV